MSVTQKSLINLKEKGLGRIAVPGVAQPAAAFLRLGAQVDDA